jgi:hypothetical protein
MMFRISFFFFPVLAAAILASTAGTALAADVNTGVAFAGPEQDFSLTVSFNGTLTGTGNGRLKDVYPFGGDEAFTINDSSPVVLNPTTFVSDPVGTATIGHDNVTLDDRTLANLDVDFRNGANWPFQFNPIDIDVDFDNLGNQTLRFDISGAITQFDFLQDPGAVPAPYSYTAPGTADTTVHTVVTAKMLDILFGMDIDLGEVANDNSQNSSDLDLLGYMTLASLGGLFPQDMLAELELNIPLSFTFPVTLTDTVVESNGDYDLTMNYTLNGTYTLSNLLYHLEDTAEGAIVPEPTSLVLLALGGLMMPRRRK